MVRFGFWSLYDVAMGDYEVKSKKKPGFYRVVERVLKLFVLLRDIDRVRVRRPTLVTSTNSRSSSLAV